MCIQLGNFCICFYCNVFPRFSLWKKRDYYQIDFGFSVFGFSVSMTYITYKHK